MTTVSTMSDSESSDSEEGLSENEELGLDEEMEDDGTDWEDTSSDEDDDEPPARRVRQEWSEGYITLLILISLLLHSTPEDPLALS